MAWYWIVLAVVGYAIAGGIVVALFELVFDDVTWGEVIPLALAWPVILFLTTIFVTEHASIRTVRGFVRRKHEKTKILKGNTNMKVETVEKYLTAFKDGTSAGVKDKSVCGLKFCYGGDNYFKVGHGDDFESDIKVRLSKADGTITYFKDKYEVVVPVDTVFSIAACYDEQKTKAEDAVEIV